LDNAIGFYIRLGDDIMSKTTILAIIVGGIGGFILAYVLFSGAATMDDMGEMEVAAPRIPAVGGFAEGQEIAFIHPEVSDAGVGEMLTDMMDSPVLVVPSLAEVPDEALASVYVFTNGVEGMGPLGYQPDVFDHPPGTDGYTPLRRLTKVTWEDETSARELKSAREVEEALQQGEISIEETDVVVNMPFLTWSDGKR
jgi:hypothetical protein